MIKDITYIRSNITVEPEIVGSSKFYVYNYKCVHYRVFDSLKKLNKFLDTEMNTWIFECENENELEKYFLTK